MNSKLRIPLCWKEAITRLRAGKVIREAGYDGEYGIIHLFESAELQQRTFGGALFEMPHAPRPSPSLPVPTAAVTQEAPTSATATPRTPLPPSAPVPVPASDTSVSGILASLDEDQRQAALTAEGSVLIVAGPGSGKTRTLTHRIAHLVAERGVPASQCLALTFTRRAAAEMRDRLTTLLPAVAGEIAIHTFHSLGLVILREHASAAGLPQNFHVAGEAERAALLGEALDLPERKRWSLLRALSKAKRTRQPATDEVAAALPVYQQALVRRHWIDFDDLIGRPLELLLTEPGLAVHYRDRFRYVAADEFQDVDEQQYRLLQALAPNGANLCVIGDPNQAIYGFRGADASCFGRFPQDYPNTTTVRLLRNYRSSETIVTASSQVIAPGGQASPIAEPVRDRLERVTIHTAPTERAEAEFVVHAIEQMIGGHSFFSIDSGRTTSGVSVELSFADFAILYRTDAQAAALCEALGRSGMPFQKHSHDPLAARPGVQAVLRELEDGDRGVTAPSALVAALQAAAERLLRRTDTELDEPAVREALHQLTQLAVATAGDRTRFAETTALATDSDTWDPRADRVSLLTIHAAKGLEFPVVFLLGLEDGLLPLRWGDGALDPAVMAEERRLFYVGMTRAKDRLVLSRALQRPWHGRVRSLDPSPFLRDIEEALLQRERAKLKERRPDDKQLALL